MAREGLRTLVIGKKRISEEHYQEFQYQFLIINIDLMKRNLW
jgi:hypothetical protein